MNKKITTLAILLIGFMLLVSSCNDFLNVNKDPNNPTHAGPALILPAALDGTANYISNGLLNLNTLGNLMMMNWAQDAGFSWYPTQMKYNVTTNFYDNLFRNAYAGVLKSYTHLANLKDPQYGFYKAIGMIMQAFHYQILVDLYGSIPYSGAEKRAANKTPKYDKGQAVYDSLVVKLNNAVDLITATMDSSSAVKPGADDGLFGHDNNDAGMAQWAAFANSVKIRLLTREDGVKPASYINKQLQMIAANGYGVIQSNVIDNPGYIKQQANKQNPYWNSYAKDAGGNETLTHGATCATQFVVNWMVKHTHDPRFSRIYEIPADGPKGVNQGGIMTGDNVASLKPPHISNLNIVTGDKDVPMGVLTGGDQGTVIMTEAEVLLNLAELKVKGFTISGIASFNSAKELYESAVTSSFVYLYNSDSTDVAIADAKDYYSQTFATVNWGASNNKMNAIMTQKWIATMALTASQSWFDYNRTGLPNAEPFGVGPARHVPPTAPTGWPISLIAGGHTERPVRLLYPQDEYNNNPNTPAGAKNTADAFGDQNKIFWAK